MGIDSYVIGIRNPDENHQKKFLAAMALKEAGIPFPKELNNYYNHMNPMYITNTSGLEIKIPYKEWNSNMCWGFEVDIKDLPSDVSTIRFYNAR